MKLLRRVVLSVLLFTAYAPYAHGETAYTNYLDRQVFPPGYTSSQQHEPEPFVPVREESTEPPNERPVLDESGFPTESRNHEPYSAEYYPLNPTGQGRVTPGQGGGLDEGWNLNVEVDMGVAGNMDLSTQPGISQGLVFECTNVVFEEFAGSRWIIQTYPLPGTPSGGEEIPRQKAFLKIYVTPESFAHFEQLTMTAGVGGPGGSVTYGPSLGLSWDRMWYPELTELIPPVRLQLDTNETFYLDQLLAMGTNTGDSEIFCRADQRAATVRDALNSRMQTLLKYHNYIYSLVLQGPDVIDITNKEEMFEAIRQRYPGDFE